MCDASRMKSVSLFRRLHVKPDRAAIAVASRLAIEGFGYAESAGLAAVEIAVVVGNAGGNAQRAKQRVVELF